MSCSLDLHTEPAPPQLTALQRRLHKRLGSPQSHLSRHCLQIDSRRAALRALGLSLQLERNGRSWHQVWRHADGRVWHLAHDGEYTLPGDALAPKRKPRKVKLGKLQPLFELKLRVSRWPTGADGVDVCLERGQVCCGEVSMPFARLRLSGADAAAVHALADELAANALLLPWMPEPSELGYQLAAGDDAGVVRAAVPDIAGAHDPSEAFRRIAESCLRHWLANRAGAVLTPEDPEYVHQLRVAIRRLRAALQLFRTQLPEDFVAALRTPLRELMNTLGRTRDLDVLIAEIVAPVVRALPEDERLQALAAELAQRLAAARAETAQRLQQPELARGLIRIHGRLTGLASLSGQPVDLRAFVDQRLRKRLKAARRCAELARIDDPNSLHELRIAIKRLRYGLEFFSGLLPAGKAVKLLKRLAHLQEDLGQLNDLASAGTLLMASAGADTGLREAVALIGGWHGARHAALLADVPEHLADVEGLRLPRLAPKPALDAT